MRILVVLASPPLSTPGQRTLSRVETLSTALPGRSVTVVNLCAAPAEDLPALSSVAAEADSWLHARAEIQTALSDCDEVMAAWGRYALSGPAKTHRRAQVEWLVKTANTMGHTSSWTVDGQARHPSRWHQYVSDKHGRTAGGTFEERLRQVLVQVPIDHLIAL